MKIRITGKKIPKAQVGREYNNFSTPQSINSYFNNMGKTDYRANTQAVADYKLQQQNPGLGATPQQQATNNFTKLSFKPFTQAPIKASGTTPAVSTAPATTATTPDPPKRFWHKEWDDEGFDTDPAGEFYQPSAPAEPKGPSKFAQAASWYNKNIGTPVENAFQGVDKAVSYGNFATQFVNSYKQKQDFDKRMRRQTSTDSLFPEVSSEMSGNRGDYVVSGSRFGEFRPDEYVVNKGMYTSQFLPKMAQYGGGIIPDALTMPIDPIELSSPMPYATSAPAESNDGSPAPAASSGVNPVAEQTWEEVSSQFEGVKHLGILGDERHKKTKSDHNSGDALDIGIKDLGQGEQIAQKLIGEAQDKNIKYIIWNKQIWNPSVSDSWRPYNGDNPHTSHVHVSFNRSEQSGGGGDIALTHNNPLNIHHGEFTSQYGGKKGSKDAAGYVSIFPDVQTGLKAATDLLFGPAYSNLTISEARNKWVSGNTGKSNNSTPDIVKTMGGDKVLSSLSPSEKENLIKQFAKWESRQAYDKISNMKIFADGGSVSYKQGDVYELTEDEIKNILSSGGDVEFL
jgi:hypothetical protein